MRGIPVTVDSAHADVVASLPSISVMTLLSKIVVAEINEFANIVYL